MKCGSHSGGGKASGREGLKSGGQSVWNGIMRWRKRDSLSMLIMSE